MASRRRPPVRPARCSRRCSTTTTSSTRSRRRRRRADPRGRRARPLRLRARARARDALREPEHEPPRAPAPPDRRGARGRRRRRTRPSSPTTSTRAGRREAVGYALAAAEQATAALAYEEAAEHYRRAGRRASPTRLALGAAELRAGDPAARATFAAAADARPRAGRPRRAGRGRARPLRPPRRGGRDRPRGHRAARGGAGARYDEDHLLAVRLRARLVDALAFARQEERREALSAEALEMAHRLGRSARAARRARGPPRRAAARRPPRRAAAPRARSCWTLAARIEERELEALGHHWRIYDLLEAGRVEDARTAHRALNTLAAALRQPLYNHFAVGWEVVWAQMAGRVDDARAARPRGLRVRRARAGARRRDDLHGAEPDPAPARGRALGLRRHDRRATSSATRR